MEVLSDESFEVKNLMEEVVKSVAFLVRLPEQEKCRVAHVGVATVNAQMPTSGIGSTRGHGAVFLECSGKETEKRSGAPELMEFEAMNVRPTEHLVRA